jgi:hypothetical protein
MQIAPEPGSYFTAGHLIILRQCLACKYKYCSAFKADLLLAITDGGALQEIIV